VATDALYRMRDSAEGKRREGGGGVLAWGYHMVEKDMGNESPTGVSLQQYRVAGSNMFDSYSNFKRIQFISKPFKL
jgi:hypothetical protein